MVFSNAVTDDVPYFEPPEKRVQVTFKIPESLKGHLMAVVRLWRAKAIAGGHDPDDINLTYVAERLLRVGVEGVWGETGKLVGLNGAPTSDDEWAALEKAIAREAVKDSKTKK